jgi:putative ABC transport system permease protein
MAASLPRDLPAQALERANNFARPQQRKSGHQTATSTSRVVKRSMAYRARHAPPSTPGLHQRIPGVTAAASSWMLPVDSAFSSSFIIAGRPLGSGLVHGGALMRPVSSGYFPVFRVPLRRGRFFTERDTASAAGVAVISEAMAKRYWANGNPIGQRITIDKYLGPDFAAPPREIVGVAGDVRDLGINQEPLPLIYVPQAQVPNGMTSIDTRVLPITWSVRTAADPYTFRSSIQRELKAASGGLAVGTSGRWMKW